MAISAMAIYQAVYETKQLSWSFFFFSWRKNKAYWLAPTGVLIPQRVTPAAGRFERPLKAKSFDKFGTFFGNANDFSPAWVSLPSSRSNVPGAGR
ncbi:hypothetical protein POF45_28700 [Pseudomonas sp. 681]|uniref:Uncharacterized protein n=1 Tax=Pseudomonas fungipugnans TaxID=3024217 RepID=A0ABT6QWV5_9PSED|nr:hypothetical protein [Pseudomonas sp. 681]MDI2595374.1 hypothetical protein [Pseudomonas sp. 681]